MDVSGDLQTPSMAEPASQTLVKLRGGCYKCNKCLRFVDGGQKKCESADQVPRAKAWEIGDQRFF